MEKDQLIQYITSATLDVFSTMLGMDLTQGEAYVAATEPSSQGDVLSLIGLAGPWVGTGTINSSVPFACRIASQFLMAEYDVVNDEVLDAFAEITNMVIGNVKTSLEEVLGPMGLSIPTVIYGRNFVSRTGGSQEWVVVPFSFEEHKVEVHLCLVPNREAHGHRPASAGLQAALN